MSVFAHLCENFVGVHPSTALFRHYFSPRIQQGDALSGSVTWIPKTATKDSYLEGSYRERWDEWRGRWCWVHEEEPQAFCEVRKVKPVRSKDWGAADPDDKKLTIAITRILRLKTAGLKVEMVASDFLRRRIAPLQNKGRPAWDYKNAADVMRLRPGLDGNLTTMGHGFLFQ